jgi:glutamine amidotransferase
VITVVDYGMGNLRNVRRALEEVGVGVIVTADPVAVREATTVILPGVGAFGEALRRIDGLGLRVPIMEHVFRGKPLLGICLGLQLLFESSEESPGVQGLGILPGAVCRFRGELPVPHIGWNDVDPTRRSVLFPDGGGVFYFVHSYYAAESDASIAVTEYGIRFASAVQKENVFGVQFHPEKSQAAGLSLLRSFSAQRGGEGTRAKPATSGKTATRAKTATSEKTAVSVRTATSAKTATSVKPGD